MPNGIIHEQLRKRGRIVFYPFSIIIPYFISPIEFKNYGEFIIGIGIVIGYELGTFVTPDWDISGTTADEGRVLNKIPVLGYFIFGISSFYGGIFRRWHRKPITHFPFLSTSIRYFLLFGWLFIYIYNSAYDMAWLIFLLIGMFIGTSFSDGVHWWADVKTKWKYEE